MDLSRSHCKHQDHSCPKRRLKHLPCDFWWPLRGRVLSSKAASTAMPFSLRDDGSLYACSTPSIASQPPDVLSCANSRRPLSAAPCTKESSPEWSIISFGRSNSIATLLPAVFCSRFEIQSFPLKSGIIGAKSILQSSVVGVATSQAKCTNSRSL